LIKYLENHKSIMYNNRDVRKSNTDCVQLHATLPMLLKTRIQLTYMADFNLMTLACWLLKLPITA